MWGQPPPAGGLGEAQRLSWVLTVLARSKDIHKRLLPDPWILRPFTHQPEPDEVLDDVDYLRVKVLRRVQYMIKRFWLPDPSLSSHLSVDLVGRSSFDSIHDLSERMNLHRFPVDQRSEDHVNVIRHHDSDAQ